MGVAGMAVETAEEAMAEGARSYNLVVKVVMAAMEEARAVTALAAEEGTRRMMSRMARQARQAVVVV